MAKYFLDTEFIEDGVTIDLISIGIIAEDGREFYYINEEFDPTKASQWVVDNVLSKLPKGPLGLKMKRKAEFYNFFNSLFNRKNKCWVPPTLKTIYPYCSHQQQQDAMLWIPKKEIANRIKDFIGDDKQPEFWAAWASYDWVVFCQLFGTMMDLPESYPYYCNDIIQCLNNLKLSREYLPPSPSDEHHALADAKWVKDSYYKIESYINYKKEY
jgi:hypothetical protein